MVVSFYRVVNGVAGGPPDDAGELLGHLTLAEIQDELLALIDASDPPIGFAEPRPPWQPETLAVATADGVADVPRYWGETRVLDSAEAVRAFLAGQ